MNPMFQNPHHSVDRFILVNSLDIATTCDDNATPLCPQRTIFIAETTFYWGNFVDEPFRCRQESAFWCSEGIRNLNSVLSVDVQTIDAKISPQKTKTSSNRKLKHPLPLPVVASWIPLRIQSVHIYDGCLIEIDGCQSW